MAALIVIALVIGSFALGTPVGEGWLALVAAPFALVGTLITVRRPGHPIGRLYEAFGVTSAIALAAWGWAWRALPGTDVAAMVSIHIWLAGFGLLVFSLLLFPDGRLPSPRWRAVAVAAAITYGGIAVSGIFENSFAGGSDDDLDAAPLFHGTFADVANYVFAALLFVNLALLAVAGASLLVRLRRARGDERQQLKWFVYAVSFVLFAFPASLLLLGDAYGVYLIPLIPAAAAVAILRHRLFDIDVVIKKTLVYGLLTAILGGAYIASVLVLQLVLNPSSDLAIAGSTLAVAALFRPVRRRVQELVDRRFYRSEYDAQRTVEAFGTRLRDEVSLETLTDELQAVVRDTMHPSHVTVWLR